MCGRLFFRMSLLIMLYYYLFIGFLGCKAFEIVKFIPSTEIISDGDKLKLSCIALIFLSWFLIWTSLKNRYMTSAALTCKVWRILSFHLATSPRYHFYIIITLSSIFLISQIPIVAKPPCGLPLFLHHVYKRFAASFCSFASSNWCFFLRMSSRGIITYLFTLNFW